MREIGSALYAFMDKYLSWIDKPKIGVTDVIEIIIIAFVLYHIMVWVKNTRAWMLFKGIIVILIFLLIFPHQNFLSFYFSSCVSL